MHLTRYEANNKCPLHIQRFIFWVLQQQADNIIGMIFILWTHH